MYGIGFLLFVSPEIWQNTWFNVYYGVIYIARCRLCLGSMFEFAHGESLRFVNAMVTVPQIGPVQARHTFRGYSDVLRNPQCARSAIGAERSIPMVS